MNSTTGMDLMLMLMIAFAMMLAENINHVRQELLTPMNNSAGELSIPADLADGAELAVAEISMADDGSLIFHFRSAGSDEPELLTNYDALTQAIEGQRPEYLRVRVDRGVPSGAFQDLLVDASLLGIRPLLSNSRD